MTRRPTCILLHLATWFVVSAVATADTKPNVLLIAVDDLNDWVGCLSGHPDTRTYADGSEELYDHENDPNEWANLANSRDLSEVITRLKTHLPKVNVEQTSAVGQGRKRPPKQ